MPNDTLDKLIWSLIFGGGLALAFGLALGGYSALGGGIVSTLGGSAIVVGVILIWVRSRRPK